MSNMVRENKQLQRMFHDELIPRFKCYDSDGTTLLSISLGGANAIVEVQNPESFFHPAEVDYRAGKIRELYAALGEKLLAFAMPPLVEAATRLTPSAELANAPNLPEETGEGDDDDEQTVILLERNVSEVVRAIGEIENIPFLKHLVDLEANGKARKGVLNALDKRLGEL